MCSALFLFGLLAFILWGYGWITAFKRWQFRAFGWRKKGALPCVVVGNLSAGGAGKTPMVLFLLDSWLHEKVGVLSRGYGRKTRGYGVVNQQSTSLQVGDEVLEIYSAFPMKQVRVCENRLEGLATMKKEGDVDWVILDDGFQHLKLMPDKAIVLTPYESPFWEHRFSLPLGRLREFNAALFEADLLVITKCPKDLDESYIQQVSETLKFPVERIYGAHYRMSECRVVYGDMERTGNRVVLVTGIAKGTDVMRNLKEFEVVKHIRYSDHQRYTQRDVQFWLKTCEEKQVDSLIVTRKDWQRVKNAGLLGEFLDKKIQIMEVHTEVEILWNKKKDFLKKVYPL